MTTRKKRRSSLYARYASRLVETICDEIESTKDWMPLGNLSADEFKTHAMTIVSFAREILASNEQLIARKQFLRLMSSSFVRERAPVRARILYAADLVVALVYADVESILERLGCLLPKRDRDVLLGDAIEAVRLQHSLSIGKPWRKFAVLATTAFWAGVIAKNAVLFAVSSQLPKRSR